MDPTRESRWMGTVGSCLAWLLVVSAVAYPIYASVADENQGLVIRLAAALVLGIVLLQVRNRLGSDLDGQPQSRFDLARDDPPLRAIKTDPQLGKLHSEVQHSLNSRRYFDNVLWPRLAALAERRGATLTRPPLRWPAARGPSLRAIGELISSVERKP